VNGELIKRMRVLRRRFKAHPSLRGWTVEPLITKYARTPYFFANFADEARFVCVEPSRAPNRIRVIDWSAESDQFGSNGRAFDLIPWKYARVDETVEEILHELGIKH
jgi:hypothetical protein